MGADLRQRLVATCVRCTVHSSVCAYNFGLVADVNQFGFIRYDRNSGASTIQGCVD